MNLLVIGGGGPWGGLRKNFKSKAPSGAIQLLSRHMRTGRSAGLCAGEGREGYSPPGGAGPKPTL